MFFYLLPLGLKLDHPVRGLLTWIVVAAIAFRFAMAFAFEGMRIQVIGYLPAREVDAQLVSAVLQSLVSPVVLPGSNPGEHIVFLCVGMAATLLFWAGFGSGIEATLGRDGFVALYLFGAALGGVFACMDQRVAMTGVFWLGHAATMAAIGACCALFFAHDIRMGYFAWFVWGGGGAGVWLVPAVFLLVPSLLLVMLPQSLVWYTSTTATGMAMHDGGLTPLSWNILLVVAGAGFAVAWTEIGKSLRGERPKGEEIGQGRRGRPWRA